VTESRKLAAILAADVVGYSRLAGVDEELILARLRTLRSDLVDPTIAVHNGRIVKRTGDGILVEFRSVVDAVRCAMEVQNGLIERNSGVPPERRIEFRIGINVGDVVEEADGDLILLSYRALSDYVGIFVAVEHANSEIIGIHAARSANRFEALQSSLSSTIRFLRRPI
jgi:class 3 adenylate cyclase